MQTEFVTMKNRTAQRRAQISHRAELVSALGWAPEGTGGDAYCATTHELWLTLNEERAKRGEAPVPRKVFAVSL